ncbi:MULTISPECIES: bifunctional molybdopterin-guanine dinucleotide biosynthesis adaptor protein MobB/molybdopterin molybdotransferase MoeA [unclassified Methylophaga]|jgi:molybdopterin molybdotransferase|uniref:molybdopterin molybdotransferase MoeA n=1 Tax=unclassified Methylophaga TaxID=2629249 RepID=UPI000C91B882|nr:MULTISPECIES: bifunctional molybdopterin-guanine dinucleotide biosynthesis adaptor protein MobB/molybdopterin molybdotransferase MoeA [unclassified Methylophaga]MAK67076.1 bifunctional molybdopterin-guanine dinucleotide biosynthesis adaptor protein MobB/molybdopterin molybdotransferase MoeA [Methylophaga sp.]MAY18114.1 bifunctional molybdopterin-guanine dinucleotide biosynthesis adaptor protein MobB/molybdopterin molybdotransferase MoeA [Methylophaga sp.]HCD05556.1 bifunctional molybdopterin-|tara:strand:- start:22294 stop:23553 length:1260 start_codon:yes stop_codon:yes gene_type:complete
MTEFTPQPSCATTEPVTTLRVEEARQRILQQITPISCWRKVALRDALGQVLHKDVISPLSVPPHANSAMDGYALRGKDLQNLPISLKLIGSAFAGRPFDKSVNAGECVRIMTGAMMPDGCDTVIMQEQAEVHDDLITLHGEHHAGENVRLAGEDIQAGAVVLRAGHRIIPADLGLLASLGLAEVSVRRRIRVAFFSTGDELRSVGEALSPGDIYDSNRYTLYAMLKRLDAEIIDMGVVTDTPDAIRTALVEATREADVVITSGGVSVGEADYVKQLLEELGEVNFWKIAMKPGRPLAYGKITDTHFFGLPGNPVSVMVTFYQFVQPALNKLAGAINQAPLILQAIAAEKIRKRPGRFEFQRGFLRNNNDNHLEVTMTGEQGSGILHSMSHANCFILLDEDCDGIAPGQSVTVQPFAGLI